jgi:HisA/HisF family protein
MNQFRIIPVIDILKSQAVHAEKGIRENYKPLKSKLFHSSNPLKIVKFFKFKWGINEIYIADLDAILKRIPNFKILSKISEIPNLNIIIDPGIRSLDDVKTFSKYDFKKLILGLETLNNLEVISESIRIIGSHKIIISIDMFNEKLTTNVKELKDLSLCEISKIIDDMGVEEIILLDLFRVGKKTGGIPPLYLNIRNIFKANILVGGGIKEFKDILKYYKYNFSGVLLGTALYDGTIEIEKIRNLYID